MFFVFATGVSINAEEVVNEKVYNSEIEKVLCFDSLELINVINYDLEIETSLPPGLCFVLGNIIFETYGESPESVALANAICAIL